MSKLKTLKDFGGEHIIKVREGIDEIRVPYDFSMLKEEAIKWIKERIKKCIFSCRYNYDRCREHKFWMERFNLTEKELK